MLLWLSTALYIFCVVLCACAAFLVLLYGTQMDLVQRAAWSTAVFASLCFDAAVMRPLMYLVCILAWSTLWRVSNRVRSIAEHGGMIQSADRRLTTHVIRQSLTARMWMVPYNTGWHLAHHVDMGVPWRNLPRLHRELVESGWAVEDLEYPTYRACWKAAGSGTVKQPDVAGAGSGRSSMLNF